MASDKKLSRMDEKIDEFRMRLKDSDQKQVFDDVFDTATLMALYDLSKKRLYRCTRRLFQFRQGSKPFPCHCKKR